MLLRRDLDLKSSHLFSSLASLAVRHLIVVFISAMSSLHWVSACIITPTVPVKAGTHLPNRWTSEAFGETRTRSGTNMFGVFSCVGSFRSRSDVVCSHSTCEVWGGWLSDVWAIGFSDWRCASESARCVGGAEYCVCFGFLSTLFRHFLFSCFGVLTRDQLLLCPFTTN